MRKVAGNFNISYVFNAKDKFSSVGRKISKSFKNIGLSAKKLPRNFDNVLRSVTKLKNKTIAAFKKMGQGVNKFADKTISAGKKIKKFGSAVTARVSAPAAAFTAASIIAFNTQAQALAKVRTGLISTNNAVGLSFSELTRAATKLQEKTLFGDEQILTGATSTLLTFTKITKKQFLAAQEATIDLAARMGTDLQSAAIQVGKALNDPVANLGALGRAGIQFSKRQKLVIKAFAETGQLGKAQAIILKELQTQFGGTAEAMAQVGTGPLKQLTNAIGDSSEEIGKLQFEILKPLVQTLKELNQKFINLSPTTKKFIAAGILIAITLGPIILIFGQLLASIVVVKFALAVLGTTLGAISLPIIAAIAAIGLAVTAFILLKENWVEVSNVIGGTIEQIIINFKILKDGVVSAVTGTAEKIASVFNSIKESILNVVNAIGKKIKAFVSGPIDLLKNAISFAKELFVFGGESKITITNEEAEKIAAKSVKVDIEPLVTEVITPNIPPVMTEVITPNIPPIKLELVKPITEPIKLQTPRPFPTGDSLNARDIKQTVENELSITVAAEKGTQVKAVKGTKGNGMRLGKTMEPAI